MGFGVASRVFFPGALVRLMKKLSVILLLIGVSKQILLFFIDDLLFALD